MTKERLPLQNVSINSLFTKSEEKYYCSYYLKEKFGCYETIITINQTAAMALSVSWSTTLIQTLIYHRPLDGLPVLHQFVIKTQQFPVKNLSICRIDVMWHFRMNCNNFGDHLTVILHHHQVKVCACQIVFDQRL